MPWKNTENKTVPLELENSLHSKMDLDMESNSLNANNNNIVSHNNNLYQFDMKHFPERPPINVAFQSITYKVKQWSKFSFKEKEILHGVSGEFKSGELTAIMGPSGAGKSTLLNILAGYRIKGSGGKVLVNGEDRSSIGIDEFKKFSCYIQQEDEHRVFLTVYEAMMFACHLKLGSRVSTHDKSYKTMDVLQMLGLEDHASTRCGALSGGQQKRLSIALELITNPPVIFLDEPTTGLDSSSSTSCISLIRSLALQGRTMICTVHQPSALIFEQFNQLYCITQGRCIYQGSPLQVAPHLAANSFVCPPYHNPADFIIEVASGEHGSEITSLVESAEKRAQESVINAIKTIPAESRGLQEYQKNNKLTEKASNPWRPHKVSGWYQFYYLFMRNAISLRRNVFYVFLRILAHLVVSLVFGYLYLDNGRTADTLFGNGIYIYGSNLFLNYTALMTVLLSFPLEYKLLKREHFNRWYSFFPYCWALMLVEIPFQMLCAMVYIIPSYILTSQPLEWFRFGLFVFFNMILTFTALGMGFLSGAIFPITISVFLAPANAAWYSMFGFTVNNLHHIPEFFHPFYYASYFRAAFQGSAYSLYGYGRPTLECNKLVYCHFRDIPMAIQQLGFYTFDFTRDVTIIVSYGAFCIALTFLIVYLKLTNK